jgi:hypothetical protein
MMVVADTVGNGSLTAADFFLSLFGSRGPVVEVVLFVFLSFVHLQADVSNKIKCNKSVKKYSLNFIEVRHIVQAVHVGCCILQKVGILGTFSYLNLVLFSQFKVVV